MLDYHEFTKEAHRRAVAFNYDTDGLRFEYERRLGGSFSRTLAGCRQERDLYREAWKIASAFRRQNQGALEALTTLGG